MWVIVGILYMEREKASNLKQGGWIITINLYTDKLCFDGIYHDLPLLLITDCQKRLGSGLIAN